MTPHQNQRLKADLQLFVDHATALAKRVENTLAYIERQCFPGTLDGIRQLPDREPPPCAEKLAQASQALDKAKYLLLEAKDAMRSARR